MISQPINWLPTTIFTAKLRMFGMADWLSIALSFHTQFKDNLTPGLALMKVNVHFFGGGGVRMRGGGFNTPNPPGNASPASHSTIILEEMASTRQTLRWAWSHVGHIWAIEDSLIILNVCSASQQHQAKAAAISGGTLKQWCLTGYGAVAER